MKLSKPFSGNYPITQKFGENLNNFYAQQGLKGHEGIDFALPMGTPILSSCSGQVISVSTDIARGEGVTVLSDATFDYNGQQVYFDVTYWHMMDGQIKVKVGDHVTTGQLLGLSNNTGQSTGPHLHFQIKPLTKNPLMFVAAPGYKECIDPMPYLDLTSTDQTLIEFSHTWKVPKEKVKAFQNKHGLLADGIVGVKTQAVLDAIFI